MVKLWKHNMLHFGEKNFLNLIFLSMKKWKSFIDIGLIDLDLNQLKLIMLLPMEITQLIYKDNT